jgi:hypothetical protein
MKRPAGPMRKGMARCISSYLIAAASLGLASGLRFLVDPLLGDTQPYTTFYLAIAVTSW